MTRTELMAFCQDPVIRRRVEGAAQEPLEYSAPMALVVRDGLFTLTACDGEDHYVFVAIQTPGEDDFSLVEIHPGLSKPVTAAREASEPDDLVLGEGIPCLSDVLEVVADAMSSDEADDGEGDEDGCDDDVDLLDVLQDAATSDMLRDVLDRAGHSAPRGKQARAEAVLDLVCEGKLSGADVARVLDRGGLRSFAESIGVDPDQKVDALRKAVADALDSLEVDDSDAEADGSN